MLCHPRLLAHVNLLNCRQQNRTGSNRSYVCRDIASRKDM